jgi:non-canonical poly(A) RNA polymerase PAPD5/7
VYRQPDQVKFSIIDPNRPSNDICGGASNTSTIRRAFSEAFKRLQSRMAFISETSIQQRKNLSILEVIIGGDYSTFEIQREHLYKCYQQQKSRE